jgi:hypothetical protein
MLVPWMMAVSRRPLISPGTRGAFRTLMTSSTVNEIAIAFQDEGFAPYPDSSYQDSSVRRVTTQEYLESVDWSDRGHVTRALRAFERLLLGVRPDRGTSYTSWDQFALAMKRDGYNVTDDGQIDLVGKVPGLPQGALAQLRDPAAIEEHLDRIRQSMDSDPALAVGSAKELIESTAKVVLLERGLAWDERKDDVRALITKAQMALSLHPSAATPGPDGSDAVKKILGGAATVALGVAELRNRGYGTGHGPAGRRTGLGTRHAHLAVNAAITWCQLMLDTLYDDRAPWRAKRP